jgi:sterol 3beta-glucosyltransferase
VSIAIESLYRDLEYARSLIKNRAVHLDDASDEEHGTVKDGPLSGYSSSGSARGALSEDWSVIPEQDDRTSSSSSRQSTSVERSGKRSSLAAAVLSVLPESLSVLSPKASYNSAP